MARMKKCRTAELVKQIMQSQELKSKTTLIVNTAKLSTKNNNVIKFHYKSALTSLLE